MFFFTLRNPLLGFIDIVLVLISALAMLIVSWRTSKIAFWMLVPYLAWLSFAAILNLLFIV
ncbi:MAG: tryptophan-rich sensory protein [Candidatus Pacearchaeota archaeon]|nr:tryptophan-rich sensory protein [Candidatus Pacearchaeota archaeon]